MYPSELKQFLDEHKIPFKAYQHPPLDNCSDADKLAIERSGTRLKNLFLRDNYGRRHFLLLTAHDAIVDLKALTQQLAVSRLGFASSERLNKYLGIKPGSVSLLSLMNDRNKSVELLIDRKVWEQNHLQCHPLVNTETLILDQIAIKQFLSFTGHNLSLVDVPLLEKG